MPNRNLLFLAAMLCLMLTSCMTVKPYQRTYLNDPEMEISVTASQKMERDVQIIREGSTTPGGTKSSGGCGCN
jgi:hypothetical protein